MNTRAILLSFVLGVATLGGCGRNDEGASHGGDEEHADEHGSNNSITLSATIAQEVGIQTAAVAAGTIRDAHEVQGLLTPVEGRHARVRARFPGIVRAVNVGVGDQVKAGQALATIESNSSLSDYVVTAPFAGTILDRSVTIGDLAGDAALFELADLSTLWVDLHLFGADAQHITAGLPVRVVRMSDAAVATTRLERILPGTATASQSTIARATIRNDDGRWRPGTAVRALVTVSEHAADRVVPLSAIQTIAGQTVVFVRAAQTYTVKPVRLGDRDAERVAVLDGVELGEEIVIEQSYLIKADIEKAGAAHED